MVFSSEDERCMKRALDLACKGAAKVPPNPMVGAVFYKDEKIIGEGFHRFFGGDHAEIDAIKNSTVALSGATLYVTLEPCCFVGKTGACTDALLQLGIERVVVAMFDPNPKVCGKGVDILKAAGIKVDVGCLEEEARLLNQSFIKMVNTGIPYVTMKVAMSLDGKIACYDGSSKWITSDDTRKYVHSLRGLNDAILVGVGTVLADNPHLGVRIDGKSDPLRVILDSNLRTPLSAQVLRDENVVVFVGGGVAHEKLSKYTSRRVKVVVCKEKIDVNFVLKKLAEMGVSRLLVEGGAEINGAFLDAQEIDCFVSCIAPKLIGGNEAKSPIGGKGLAPINSVFKFERMEMRMIGNDVIIQGLKFIY